MFSESSQQAGNWKKAMLATVKSQTRPESYNAFELFMGLRWQDRFRMWLP